MDWGELFGAMVGSAGASMMLHSWMKIEKLEVLRLTIDNDIRECTHDTLRIMIRHLDDRLKLHRLAGESEEFDRANLVKQVLLEQAEERGLR